MNDLINRAIEKLGDDKSVRDYLEIAQAQLANIKSGKEKLPPDCAGKLAVLLGEDPAIAEFQAQIEVSRSPRAKEWWRKRLEGAAGFFIVGCLLVSVNAKNPDHGFTKSAESNTADHSNHYAYLRNIIKRLLQLRSAQLVIRCLIGFFRVIRSSRKAQYRTILRSASPASNNFSV